MTYQLIIIKASDIQNDVLLPRDAVLLPQSVARRLVSAEEDKIGKG